MTEYVALTFVNTFGGVYALSYDDNLQDLEDDGLIMVIAVKHAHDSFQLLKSTFNLEFAAVPHNNAHRQQFTGNVKRMCKLMIKHMLQDRKASKAVPTNTTFGQYVPGPFFPPCPSPGTFYGQCPITYGMPCPLTGTSTCPYNGFHGVGAVPGWQQPQMVQPLAPQAPPATNQCHFITGGKDRPLKQCDHKLDSTDSSYLFFSANEVRQLCPRHTKLAKTNIDMLDISRYVPISMTIMHCSGVLPIVDVNQTRRQLEANTKV